MYSDLPRAFLKTLDALSAFNEETTINILENQTVIEKTKVLIISICNLELVIPLIHCLSNWYSYGLSGRDFEQALPSFQINLAKLKINLAILELGAYSFLHH